MGWNKKAKNGYNYVLTENNHTLPYGNDVPTCIVVCSQHSYTISSALINESVSLGGWQTVFHNNSEWKVVSARVQLVRYFAASTAKITLAVDISQMDGKIPPPGLTFKTKNPDGSDVSKHFKGDNFKYNEVYNFTDPTKDKEETYELRPEMQIEIYMGYLNKYESVASYITKKDVYEIDSTKFTKVFNGVIDTVDLKLGRGENPMDGITCTITARDQIRYLIDNKFFGPLQIPGEDFSKGVNRNKIVRALIKQGSADACSVEEENEGGILFHPTGRPPMKVTGLYSNEVTDKDKAGVLSGVGSPFSVADQFPVDAIRWFSLIEPYPRELYSDIETGKIAWTVRMLGEPVKTQDTANLFGELEAIQDSLNYGEIKEYSSIIKEYLDKLIEDNNYPKGYIDKYTAKDASQISDLIDAVYDNNQILDNDIFPKWALIALYAHESGLNPYVSLRSINKDGSNAVARTGDSNLVLMPSGKSTYIPGTGASGIAQVMLNTHLSRVDSRRAKSYEQAGITSYINYQKIQGTNIPECTEAYINLSAKIIKDNIDALKRHLNKKDINTSDLIANYFNSKMDFIQIVMRYYHGQSVLATKAAFDEATKNNSKLTYALYQKYADQNEYSGYKNKPIPFQEDVVYMRQVFPHIQKIIKSRDIALTEDDKKAYDKIKSSSPYGVSVFKGKNNPWLFSYKRTITTTVNGQKVTIKPNIISGHSGWSTLGVITAFTLLNPASANGMGGVGIKSSHSWFGDATIGTAPPDPTNTTPMESFTPVGPAENIYRSSLGPPSISDPNRLAEIAKNSRDIAVDQENREVNRSQIAPNTVVSKLKYLSKIRLPYRHRYIWDESSDSRMTDVSADFILNAMMNIYGRDIHSADFIVPLNPDIRPGQAAQMYNMGFFSGELFRIEGVIHMFALGGVQNGCTTMVAVVSPQGSQDPIEAVQELNKMVELQNAGLNIVEEAKSDVYEQIPINYFKNHTVDKIVLNTTTIDYTMLNFYDEKLRKIPEDIRNRVSSKYKNAEMFVQDFNNFLQNYCFSYVYAYADTLAGQGNRDIYSYSSNFDDTDSAKYTGVSFKAAAKDLNDFLNNISNGLADYNGPDAEILSIKQDIEIQTGDRTGVSKFLDKYLSPSASHANHSQDAPNLPFLKFIISDIESTAGNNLQIIKFRKDNGLIAHQIADINRNFRRNENKEARPNSYAEEKSKIRAIENPSLLYFYIVYLENRGLTPEVGNISSVENERTIVGHIKKSLKAIVEYDYKKDYEQRVLNSKSIGVVLESSSEYHYLFSNTEATDFFKHSLAYSYLVHVYLSYKSFEASVGYSAGALKDLLSKLKAGNLEKHLVELMKQYADLVNTDKSKLG